MKKQQIFENYIYVTDKGFMFSLDDDKQRQFGILFEITNMYEATGENEFKQYPFLVSASIVADKCNKSFNESGDNKPDKLSLIYDAYNYMGGVPIEHVLTHAIKSSNEIINNNESNFEILARQFNPMEAKIVSKTHSFGTIAAQFGTQHEHQYMQFKTEEAAIKFIDYLIKNRVSAMRILIGFSLDRSINLIGHDGWSVMQKMVKGCK